ncbi:MAG: transposase [Planctomycetota bacterium]
MPDRRVYVRELPFRGRDWGGRRPGAGRKPVGARAGASHRKRAPLAARFPVHVTARLRKGLPSLRRQRVYRALRAAFAAASSERFRLVHYSVQSNHLHLLVEARDRQALSRGLQGLLIRVARRVNHVWERRGRVFADRYHDHVLRTPREVRHALSYVLHNAQRHGSRLAAALDVFASGWWFDGWKTRRRDWLNAGTECPVQAARTWLLSRGWRRHGLLPLHGPP